MDENKQEELYSCSKQDIIHTKSAKTLIERAKREVPGFISHYAKFEEQMTIGGYSQMHAFQLFTCGRPPIFRLQPDLNLINNDSKSPT